MVGPGHVCTLAFLKALQGVQIITFEIQCLCIDACQRLSDELDIFHGLLGFLVSRRPFYSMSQLTAMTIMAPLSPF